MRRTSCLAIMIVVGIFCAASGSFAQYDVADKYLISAKAGGVNYVEGAVSIMRANGKSGLLLKKDRVDVGDRVSSGSDGRAEVLLNPGSYIRLGANSSFEFGTTDLEDLKLRLDSGSAIFEVFADDEFRVSITTPKGKIALVETGVYRVDVYSDGNAVVAVTKGKAEVGESSAVATATVVKEGRTGTVGAGAVAVAKFDKGKRDNFAQWSKDRSKELAKVSSSINDRNLNATLMRGFGSGRWNIYNSFGLWIFNAGFGGYCFMPFSRGWRSPYGGWYDNWIYWPYTRWPYNGGPVGTPVNPTNRKPDGPVKSDLPTSAPGKYRDPVAGPPPFTKIDRGGSSGIGKGGVDPIIDFDRSGGGRSGGSPSFNPPVNIPSPPPPPSSEGKGRERP